MRNPNPNTSGLEPYKPTWKHGKTKTIRVPISLADQILEFARQLDNGKNLTDLKDVIATILAKIEAKELGYQIDSNAYKVIEELKKLI